ncbi:hypothetical protein THOM_2409 [Trachipleistophora hominis]|uniref:Uncharacterized protein n=1 Tax=Trachipleistophora hominis TaxID=72359 RepID=L7JT84_TRAHO|nr:hypothetical protein THOM_2409 [Trachipleistophora hominis]
MSLTFTSTISSKEANIEKLLESLDDTTIDESIIDKYTDCMYATGKNKLSDFLLNKRDNGKMVKALRYGEIIFLCLIIMFMLVIGWNVVNLARKWICILVKVTAGFEHCLP